MNHHRTRRRNRGSTVAELGRREWLLGGAAGLAACLSTAVAPRSARGAGGPDADAAADLPRSSTQTASHGQWIAAIGQHKLSADSPQAMVKAMLERARATLPHSPDLICLPETFPTARLGSSVPSPEEIAQAPDGPLIRQVAQFAAKHSVNMVCPLLTRDSTGIYNAAVILDRQGNYIGEYRKINPTDGELQKGILPGPLDPPVFDLDIGRIGVQICFDVNWPENWRRLAAAGAQLIVWPSAFAGGEMLRALALTYRVPIVSATRIPDCQVIDALGDVVAATGRFDAAVCAPLDLQSAVVQGWQNLARLDRACEKYGRDLRVKLKHVEALALVSSVHRSLSTADILAEFQIETSRQMLARVERQQQQRRP